MTPRTCTDCTRPYVKGGRGLCNTCYARHKRHGTLPPKERGGPDVQCRAQGCENVVGSSGAKGLCPKHYQRLTKTRWGLAQPPRTAPLAERFASKISSPPCDCGLCNGCLRWAGGINKKTGYGHFTVNGKARMAHRIAWELANDRPVPDEAAIDHVYEKGCRHRDCVRPDHLEAVTDMINNQRMPRTEHRIARLSAAGQKGAAVRWSKSRRELNAASQSAPDAVLSVIKEHPDGIRAITVAAQTGCALPAIRQALVRLAKRGLIRGNGSGLYYPSSS